jgi:two-component system OmpR family response regulator
MLNPKRVLSRQQLLSLVWGDDFTGYTRVVETYISYLRRKIDSDRPPLLHTVRAVGYVLRLPRE